MAVGNKATVVISEVNVSLLIQVKIYQSFNFKFVEVQHYRVL